MQAVVLVVAAAAGTPKLWGMKKNGLHFSLSRFLHLLLFSSRIFPVRLCEINAHISVLFQTDTIRNPTIFHRSGSGVKASAAACHFFFFFGPELCTVMCLSIFNPIESHTVVCKKVHPIGYVWCKMALGEVGVSLPWWCPALVLLAPGYWSLFLNLIIFS